ncbi:MAG TPA: MFS transporter [Bacteroidales bacterium]|nr:MFS transporter [Bacteroidales bacterium]HPI29910.1 MFS transporter [Bacteroidales bacterium]HQN15765.1 MFS transporter [Bacteroidales bacterium]HQP15209.1 MFS transporter [Bacteroidales bacterium]
MKSKPRLSFWQIWNMSFGFLGIQFGFALQNANVSRIFETLGAKIEDIPILWIAAPLTGLIVQPIIGHLSDHTWNRLGRRRPYFLTGAILASLALLVMPNSPVLWVAAGMLWIMDASINISMEPFRAFVGDMLPSEQRTKGFAMQSFFIGTGAVVASALPYLLTNLFGVENTAPEGIIPPSVKYSFYIGAAAFFTAVLWTVLRTKEYPPEELASFSEKSTEEAIHKDKSDQYDNTALKKKIRNAGYFIIAGLGLSAVFFWKKFNGELYIFSLGLLIFGLLMLTAAILEKKGYRKNGFVEILSDFSEMPATMKQLAVVQFFSWFALFAMWIYTTPAVTSHIYHTSDTKSALFNEGANWVGICFAVYNGVAALIAFLLPILARFTSRKITHMICLVAGGAGLISIFLFKSPELLLLSMVGVGIAWASILSMPYAILTGSLPREKMGVYMGIFNFFIVIPQILAASILGFITKEIFKGEAIYSLILGGISMAIAALMVLFVKDND